MLNTILPHDIAILLLDIYSRSIKTNVYKSTYTQMLIEATLFVIAKSLGQVRWSSIDEWINKFGIVQFSRSVLSDSLWSHGLQHARPPCSSPAPGVYSNSCRMSWWRHPTWHPLLLLPSIFPSIRVFSNESALCIKLPKYWSFSFSISPSNEHPGLISFRMDWLDLLEVQGTLKSLLQHYSSGSAGKESACNAGHPGLIPGSGRYPGKGNGYPLQ